MYLFFLITISINALGAIFFAVVNRKRGATAMLSVFFLMVPVVGFIIFGVAMGTWRLISEYTYDRDSLVHRVKPSRAYNMPETDKELDVIPVEDAMAVSTNSEKRQLMLDQLKKDIGNYKTILSASADEDSETAHYVAAAKLEAYNKLIVQLKRTKIKLKEQPSSEAICDLLDCYINMIQSSVLAQEEVTLYHGKYVKDFENGKLLEDFAPDARHYSFYIHCLIALGKMNMVKESWDTCAPESKTETLYRSVLEMYYNSGDKVGFYAVLDELCASGLALSADGVDMLRFWLGKRKQSRSVS